MVVQLQQGQVFELCGPQPYGAVVHRQALQSLSVMIARRGIVAFAAGFVPVIRLNGILIFHLLGYGLVCQTLHHLKLSAHTRQVAQDKTLVDHVAEGGEDGWSVILFYGRVEAVF